MSLSNHTAPLPPKGGLSTAQPPLVIEPALNVGSLQSEVRSEALATPPLGGRGAVWFLFLLFSFSLHAQDVRFTFDKQKILLGEPIGVKVEAMMGAGQSGDLFPKDTLPHFEVLDQSKIDTFREINSIYLKQTLTITSWDSGSWQLPSAIIKGVASQLVTIEVGYTPGWDPKQPYNDIKGIQPVEAPAYSNWWWYLVGLAVLVALFMLFFPAGKKQDTATQLDKSAYKKAMQQLEKLQKENLALSNAKQYYTELINIFRTYLKSGKGIHSFSKTTDDLSIQLQPLKLPQADYNNLVQTLRLSDLVKFAAYKPEGTINNEALNTIKESITAIEGHAV